MLLVSRDSGTSIEEAWRHLGFAPLRPRRLRALTLAVRELWAIDEAVADIAKKRTKKDPPPSVQNVLLAADIGQRYGDWLDSVDTSDVAPTVDGDSEIDAILDEEEAVRVDVMQPRDFGPPDADGLVGEPSLGGAVPLADDDPMIAAATKGGA